MKQDIKDQWVDALFSGEYVQGTGVLKKKRDGTGIAHCCLGVLCEILNVPNVYIAGSGKWNFFDGDGFAFVGLPADKIIKDVEISFEQVTKLVNMNDTGCTFNEIAHYIKDNL